MNLKNVCSRKKIIQIPNINFILMLVSKVHMFHLREEKKWILQKCI